MIVLGSPLIANDRISGDRARKKSRRLILELIEEKKAFFLIVSGEIHFAEYTQLNFLTRKDDPSDLYEVVSSGLSHSVGFSDIAPDFIMDNFNVPPAHQDRSMRFMSRNFGLLEFDPVTRSLTSSIFDHEGRIRLHKAFDTRVITRVAPSPEPDEHYLVKNLKFQLHQAVARGRLLHLAKFLVLRFYRPVLVLLLLALAIRWLSNKTRATLSRQGLPNEKKLQ